MKRHFLFVWIAVLVLTAGASVLWGQATAQISGAAKGSNGSRLARCEDHRNATRRGGCAIKRVTFLTTPSAPIKGGLRRYFLRSRPPLLYEEGTRSSFQNFILWANVSRSNRGQLVNAGYRERTVANGESNSFR